MTADQLISDAAALPPSDRLRIAQAIWDSLPDDAYPPPGPEVKAELDRTGIARRLIASRN